MSDLVMQAALEAAFTVAFEKVLAKFPPREDDRIAVACSDRPAVAIKQHLAAIDKWSSTIAFRESDRPRLVGDLFVDLDLQLIPRHQSLDPGGEARACSVSDLTRVTHSFVLLGDVGAGKTTALKKIVRTEYVRFLQAQTGYLPILFLLRNLDDEQSLAERILGDLGIRTVDQSISDAKTTLIGRSRTRARMATRLLAALLDELPAKLYLDGLDEVRSDVVDSAVQDVRELYLTAGKGLIGMSCRSAAYQYSIDAARPYELRPLTEAQIATLVDNWLRDGKATADFMQQIKGSPYSDTSVRPLTLAHLCALYTRYRRIPDKPKTVYRKLMRLLLEEWSLEWSVTRKSQYSEFDIDRKQEFLERLAWEIPSSAFSHGALQEAYRDICEDFRLPVGDAATVARELESHTGLLVQTGYEQYAFAHKSIHEYLAAEYLVKAPTLVLNRASLHFRPNEFAVATALTGRPSDFFSYVAFEHILPGADGAALLTYLNRLRLERPDFPIEPQLGLAVLAIDFRSWFVEQRDRVQNELLNLIELPHIRESIHAAAGRHLHFVQAFENGDQMYETHQMPSACAAMPLHLRVSALVAEAAFDSPEPPSQGPESSPEQGSTRPPKRAFPGGRH